MSAIHLLEEVVCRLNLKNDAALARTLKVAPPVISKVRHGRTPVGPMLILRIHECDPKQFPVKFIREILSLT